MEHLKKIFGYFKEEYTKLYAVKNLERRGARYILVFVILIVFFGFFSIKFVQNRSQWVTELPLISRTEGIDVYAKVYGWTVGIVSIIALLQSICELPE